jgi:hypothetical protein
MTDARLGPGTLMLDTFEFGAQASAVRLTPDVSSEDGTPTLAAPDPAPLSTIAWHLNVDAIQDFDDPAGFVNYLMDNALAEVDFTWTPNTAAGTVYSGVVQIVPMEVGGDVAVQIVTSVELPVIGEPTRVDGAIKSSIASSSSKGSKATA